MREPVNRDAAVVLFSGGQDSTTCLFWAKKRFAKVYALAFSYGQKHIHEIDIARQIAANAGVEFHVIDARFISALGSSSLTDSSIEMDREQKGNTVPNTFVPGRNMFFISMAAVFARERNVNHLVTGVSQSDFSGYPDCRDSFIKSMNVTLNEAMDWQFVIDTPLMWLTKAETWELADSLGVFDLVRNETLTCYNGIPGDGCGDCPSCLLRKAGLEEYLAKRNRKQ